MFSGGALSRFTVFALGIMPYISVSIIMQLVSYVVPSFEQLKKEGEAGRRKITQYKVVLFEVLRGEREARLHNLRVYTFLSTSRRS